MLTMKMVSTSFWRWQKAVEECRNPLGYAHRLLVTFTKPLQHLEVGQGGSIFSSGLVKPLHQKPLQHLEFSAELLHRLLVRTPGRWVMCIGFLRGQNAAACHMKPLGHLVITPWTRKTPILPPIHLQLLQSHHLASPSPDKNKCNAMQTKQV